MVAKLTIGKKGYKEVREEMLQIATRAQRLKDAALTAVDADTDAFNHERSHQPGGDQRRRV